MANQHMPKQTLTRVIAAAACVTALAASAEAQTVEFRGALCLKTVSASCPGSGWAIGDCQLMRYSPPNLGTNGVTTEVSLFGQSVSDNYSLPTGTLIGTVYKAVDGVHIGRSGYTFSTTTMRITSQSPATLTATTANVSLRGNITNFSNTTGCDVGFVASATLRP